MAFENKLTRLEVDDFTIFIHDVINGLLRELSGELNLLKLFYFYFCSYIFGKRPEFFHRRLFAPF
jgi:hypothetical protein